MSFRIAVIGAGWYGCHIALAFTSLGMQVDVFEKNDRPLHCASGNNQFRLHLGFHYARHHGTRVQSRDGFIRFIERYPTLSAEIPQNIYAVPRETSLIDFQTYKLIMVSSGLNFVEAENFKQLLHNVEGIMLTNERVLLIDRARRYFLDSLRNSLHFGHKIDSVQDLGHHILVNGKTYDYVVDATWGHRDGLHVPVYYEPTLLLYYETSQHIPAITFVDGPLSSIYPTEDPNIYTLSSVIHTPLGRFSKAGLACERLNEVDAALVSSKRQAMEAQISQNFPAFRDYFRFMGIQLSAKTKPVGNFDDRSCYVYQKGRLFTVLSGKIDTIFFATERILSLIEASNAKIPVPETPGIKNDILVPDGLSVA